MDTFGQNDPYCVVRVTLAPCSEDADKGGAIRPSSETPNSTVSQQTGVADDGGVDPVWGGGRGEQLRFELDEAPLRVELLCFDRDVGSADDIIGEADIYIEVRSQLHTLCECSLQCDNFFYLSYCVHTCTCVHGL